MAKSRTHGREADTPSTDEAAAFRTAMQDVKPLPAKAQAAAHSRADPSSAARAKPSARVRRRPPVRTLGDLESDMPLVDPAPMLGERPAISGADPLAFQRAGVGTQTMRKLRRGLYPVEDELDLHGLSQAAARNQLAEFLTYNRDAGRRCVRIVHGKGYRSGSRGPVLKIAVDLWLRRHLDVMAFTSARPIDGGTGAVYVLLRA